MLGLPQQVWIHSSTSSRPSTSWLKASTMKSSSSVSSGWKAAVKWIVGSSIWITFAPAAASWRSSRFIAPAMSQISCFLSSRSYSVGVAVEEDRQHLRRAGPELDRLAGGGAGLGDPPQLGVLERVLRVVLDLADDARPPPRRLDLVHQRPGREREQAVAGALVLQLLVLEALPALQRVVVPRAAGEVLVEVVVAVGEDVEARRAPGRRSPSSARRGTARGSGRRAARCRAAGPTGRRRTSEAAATSR